MGKLKRSSFKIIIQGLLAIVLVGSCALSGQTKGNRSACLAYEPAVVRLMGTLVRKTFPGPPEYKDLSRGDRPETYWLLVLSQPACVDEDSVQPDLNPAHDNIRTMQLVVSEELNKKYKYLVGRRIVATGTLFGEHTAHHRTPVLLTVKTMAAAK
jgi:uncharacterized protein DUF4431